MKTSIYLSGTENSQLCVHSWRSDSEPKGVIHILHGMADHAERYGDFAEYMIQMGYVVYAHDHRKQGKSLTCREEVGIFNHQDTFENMVADVHIVHEYIQQIDKGLNVVVLGHSMGSMLCRRYIQEYGHEVSKAIIMGTMMGKNSISRIGIVFGKLVALTSPKKKRSSFLNRLAVGSFNKPFEPGRTAFDWLSRDNKQVDQYIQDPLCGYDYSALFYVEFLKGILAGHKRSNIIKTPHIPLLFISGSNDPVGLNGQGVSQVVELYRNLGYNNDITLKLFDGARHEILNETNQVEVYHYIAGWVKA